MGIVNRHSFSNKLVWWIILAVSVVMIPLSVLIYRVVNASMTEMESKLFTELVNEAESDIEVEMSVVSAGSINSLDKIEARLSSPDKMESMLQRIVSQNPNIVGCGIAFRDSFYAQKGRLFEPYAIRQADGNIGLKQIGGPSHDYTKMDWFLRGMRGESRYWTDPYYDDAGGLTVMTSFCMPIKDSEGESVGVLGLDLSLYWLVDMMKATDKKINEKYQSQFFQESKMYSFILNDSGIYVAHPDKGRIMKDRLPLALKGSGQTHTTIDGDDMELFHTPIDGTPWTLVIAVPTDMYLGAGRFTGMMLLVMIAVSLLIVLLGCAFAIQMITGPLAKFAASTREIAKGNFHVKLPNPQSSDEVGQLYDPFQDMQHSLSRYVEELQQTTASKAAIENELKIARDIQMSMVPKTFPPYPQRSDIDVYGYMKPAKEVGGDLFDFFIRDEKLYFCIGDVAGKGVPAALLMTVATSLFRSVATYESSPAAMVTQMNRIMCEGNENSMFVTFFAGVLDLATGRLRFCNAGCDAPLIVDKDVAELPLDPHLAIGLMDDAAYEDQEVTLARGTNVLLFTDGLIEATSTSPDKGGWELFGIKRVMAAAREALANHRQEPRTLTAHMLQAVAAFVGDSEQSDDMTMLVVGYK